MGQSKPVQGQAGSFWHTKEMNIELMNFNCCITNKGHPPFKSHPEPWTVLFYSQVRFRLKDLPYMNKTESCSKPAPQWATVRDPAGITSSPAPNYLQVIWDEDFASFLNHGLGFQLFFGELALARVEHLLARNAGQSKICRIWLIAHRNLDSLRINGARCVPVCWQDLTCRKTGSIQLC